MEYDGHGCTRVRCLLRGHIRRKNHRAFLYGDYVGHHHQLDMEPLLHFYNLVELAFIS